MSGIVPSVDLSGWSTASAGERRDAVGRVDAACRAVGFLQVSGHGIPEPVIAAALAASDQYFALSLQEKMSSRPDRAEINRGYAPLGSEALAYSLGRERPPDLFEAFNIGDDSAPAGTPDAAANLFAPNIWPAEPRGFRPAIWAYFLHAVTLSRTLLDIFALALDLEPGWFGPRTDHATLTMRTIRYQRHPDSPAGPPPAEQLGMSEHTDYGIVTVLYADAIPGLQIVDPAGAWHDVIPDAGCLLVNLGDLLAQWTNDRWKSTIHRVVPPPPGTIRRSMAMFNDGNYDTVVEVLPTCTGVDEPPRYPPTTAGEHLLAKLLGPRQQTPATATDTTAGRLPTA
jgi:isopenicillin N synthase-like dioxygenase